MYKTPESGVCQSTQLSYKQTSAYYSTRKTTPASIYQLPYSTVKVVFKNTSSLVPILIAN